METEIIKSQLDEALKLRQVAVNELIQIASSSKDLKTVQKMAKEPIETINFLDTYLRFARNYKPENYF